MVVTNLRLPEDEYLTTKTLAGEDGLSVNEFIRRSLSQAPVIAQFGLPNKTKKPKKNIYQALRELAEKKFEGEGMGLSEEDEIIYED